MKIAVKWLNDYLNFGDHFLSTDKICDVLSVIGFESEVCMYVPINLHQYKICKVMKVNKHENADKLSVCRVFDGIHELQIVCGAKNVYPGMISILAPVNTMMPSGMIIEQVKIRGVESNGMLCSYDEIGLSNWFESDGIADLSMILSESDVGKCLNESHVMDYISDIIHIQFTHNRKNANSILDIARELSACQLGKMRVDVFSNNNLISILNDYSKVNDLLRYVAMNFAENASLNDVLISKSNETAVSCSVLLCDNDLDLMKKTRLRSSSIKFDSALNAACEYIAMEMNLRFSCTQNNNEYLLYLENAGENLEIAVFGLMRLISMISSFAEVRSISVNESLKDCEVLSNQKIHLSLNKLRRILAYDIHVNTVENILKRLDFGVNGNEITIPQSRLYDVAVEEDLIEEIMRISGIDSIPEQPLVHYKVEVNKNNNLNHEFLIFLKKAIASIGYFEVITWSFIPKNIAAIFSSNELIEIRNPISKDMAVMRTSLLHGLLSTFEYHNSLAIDATGFFELGSIYHDIDSESLFLSGLLPFTKFGWVSDVEPTMLTIKSQVMSLLAMCSVNTNDFKLEKLVDPDISRYIDGAAVFCSGENIGYIGYCKGILLKNYNIKQKFGVFELNISSILQCNPQNANDFLSCQQSVSKDFSFEVKCDMNVDLLVQKIMSEISKFFCDEIVMQCKLFDVFDLEDSDTYSIGLKFIVRLNDRTFQDIDLTNLHNIVISVAEQNGAKLRFADRLEKIKK
ncbi:YtpR family tRNA-binding protein [Candidatus Gromoviella agglomerans]|uniref:YtpR family tRNA-binding protein n=1 Tax=Candidatus Gromoviella agglomerans TaxID=2806609 RepID=UPI001E530F7C|nr:hypothetical protein [Candidatus Gromoviella agglomerans]UFX98488.1 Phenylalanine--tRNA ligase beta subunit [Candidatus Gromoviella agglomerans]